MEKKAIIIPIPKPNKDHNDLANFRPISLLNTLAKVTEKRILTRLKKIDHINNKLQQEQFRFRQGHNTVMQIARISNDIIEHFNTAKVTVMSLLDIEKSFDTIWTT